MNFSQILAAIVQLSGLLFVVSSMLAMGMSLTVAQIVGPLKNARLVILALLANFVLVPLVAFILTRVIPLEQSLQIGLIVLSTAAGAPFLPKLVQTAKGNLAFGVGLMVLLMVVTVFYMPIVLPLLLPGVSVDPWAIARSLIVTMLIPLAIGLLLRAFAVPTAARLQPLMSKLSNLALLILLVVGIGANIPAILALIGSGGILAVLLFIAASFLIGFLLSGKEPTVRSVSGLGTAQRNVAAALIVAAQNFGGTNTLSYVLVSALVLLVILLPLAKRLGAGVAGAEPAPAVAAK